MRPEKFTDWCYRRQAKLKNQETKIETNQSLKQFFHVGFECGKIPERWWLLSSRSTRRFSLKKYKADRKREYGLQKLKT